MTVPHSSAYAKVSGLEMYGERHGGHGSGDGIRRPPAGRSRQRVGGVVISGAVQLLRSCSAWAVSEPGSTL
ncbi:hypothetical protein [Streptomyces sp. NRRL S-646]|uniref:hypothetical protein n=1 Tax=Streptomyces sp. NRRL S-646 TaxID=1463917 RepID=UPI0004CA6EA5|nr:hypothetical protein [Streptomyces sp. NRRL S-646]